MNENFERVYIPPNITAENASTLPMQLVEKSVQKKPDINASFTSTSSDAVSILSILETDNDNESVQPEVNLSRKEMRQMDRELFKVGKNSNMVTTSWYCQNRNTFMLMT